MLFSRTLLVTIFLSASFVYTSCSYKQQQALFITSAPVADSVTGGRANTGSGTSDYRIKSQDILQIRNLQSTKYIVDDEPGTTTTTNAGSSSQGQTYQVEDDGTVALPVIGHVPIAGFTRAEAAKQIEDLYRKNLLKNPIIELKIVNLKVTLLGEVKTQGNYPLIKDKTNLVEMIGEAGGLTDRADEKTIKIIRGDPKKPLIMEINLSNINSLSDPGMILQNNDIIYIAQSRRAVKNDQLQNFSTTVQPVLTILNSALIIYTLIHR